MEKSKSILDNLTEEAIGYYIMGDSEMFKRTEKEYFRLAEETGNYNAITSFKKMKNSLTGRTADVNPPRTYTTPSKILNHQLLRELVKNSKTGIENNFRPIKISKLDLKTKTNKFFRKN
ncbi:MAG: hypothetical protein KC516_02240 [Nanoarchaeota archaeon]|nr:hypothetical protein [Nanoarchaeota archaeon]